MEGEAPRPGGGALAGESLTVRDLVARFPALREDQIRYLQKLGLVGPVRRGRGELLFSFHDLSVLRQAHQALVDGRPFRAVARALEASRHGQLALDFRLEAQPAKILSLVRPGAASPAEPSPRARAVRRPSGADDAEACFHEASALDNGDPAQADAAAALYRRALERDPYLVAALINLGNLHYASSRFAEALALYEQAGRLAPAFFEAHYNLANVLHDIGRLDEAVGAYEAALGVNAQYADAHFYLAVTLEKLGRSADARPHWQAYRELAPDGDWIDLAREFGD